MCETTQHTQPAIGPSGHLTTVPVELRLPKSFETEIGVSDDLAIMIYGSHSAAITGLKHNIEGFGLPVLGTTMDPVVVMSEISAQKIDLIIFDLYHRTDEVFELASSIRRVSNQTQILFMIDEPTVDELRLAIRNGVNGFFRKKSTKPIPLAEIIVRVARGEAMIEGSLLAEFLHTLDAQNGVSTSADQARAVRLSNLDREILARTTSGDNSRRIADDCGFSAGFIRNRLSAIYRTIGVSNKSQAVVFAVRTGITNW